MMNWYFASGDGIFFWKEQIARLSWKPVVFDMSYGFGLSNLTTLWLNYPFRLFTKILATLGLSWFIIDKLLWLSVFLLALYTSFRLARYVLGKTNWIFLASIIYATNTYILLLFGGGQLGVALGYSVAPFVLLKFMECIDLPEKRAFPNSILNGVYIALLICFDLRLAYLMVLAAGAYLLFRYFIHRNGDFITTIAYAFIIPGFIAGLIHAFWILPTAIASRGIAGVGEDYTNPGILKFFSVADFSHAIGLLHPNWPENLFGKVYFMQPEFLIMPILAFCALLFVGKKETDTSKKILFFTLLSLCGAFFAKGVMGPFGGVFQWMFIHVPGFIMFRDPTKFYLFVAMGYLILIPFTLERFAKKILLNEKIVCMIFIAFWFFTLRHVLLGQMRGNFKPLHIPNQYIALKDMLVGDATPSRTLWIPRQDAFAYESVVHPIVTSDQLFNNASISAVIALTQTPEFMNKLVDSGVRYVIVPIDLNRDIFLTDYQYNAAQRSLLVNSLKKTTLKLDNHFTDVAVFKNDLFTMTSNMPSAVERQQMMADVGLGISVIALVTAAGAITLLKRRK